MSPQPEIWEPPEGPATVCSMPTSPDSPLDVSGLLSATGSQEARGAGTGVKGLQGCLSPLDQGVGGASCRQLTWDWMWQGSRERGHSRRKSGCHLQSGDGMLQTQKQPLCPQGRHLGGCGCT